MADLEQEFQECQNNLRVVKGKIVDNETLVIDDDDAKTTFGTHATPEMATETRPPRHSENQYTVSASRPGLSAYTGRAKLKIMKKDHVFPSKGKPHLCEDYPTIVKLDQGWAETWCHVCGANSTKRSFFAGFHGLLNHVQVRHRKQHPRISFKELVEVCGIHYLEKEEVVSVCLREKKVNHRFELEDGNLNELSDDVLMRKANERLGGPRTALDGNLPNANADDDEEEITVKPRGLHSSSAVSRSEDHVEQNPDDEEEEQVLDMKIKEEIQTDSEYEDGDAGSTEADDEHSAHTVISTGERERKRRRLHVLPGSDDEDEYEQ